MGSSRWWDAWACASETHGTTDSEQSHLRNLRHQEELSVFPGTSCSEAESGGTQPLRGRQAPIEHQVAVHNRSLH